jgi:hypothetical protein
MLRDATAFMLTAPDMLALSCPAQAGHPVFTLSFGDYWIIRMRG